MEIEFSVLNRFFILTIITSKYAMQETDEKTHVEWKTKHAQKESLIREKKMRRVEMENPFEKFLYMIFILSLIYLFNKQLSAACSPFFYCEWNSLTVSLISSIVSPQFRAAGKFSLFYPITVNERKLRIFTLKFFFLLTSQLHPQKRRHFDKFQLGSRKGHHKIEIC